MEKLTFVVLLLFGFINGIPVIGVLSAEILMSLYGLPSLDGDLVILMRHRALLFGLLGAVMIVGAFKEQLRSTAIVAGLVSMAGFVVLALLAGEYGFKVERLVWIDVIGAIALVVVAVPHFRRG